MILGAGEMQVPVIKRANDMGLATIVVDFDANAPGFVFSKERIVVSTNDFESILKIAKDRQIDGILTTSDYPVRVVAKVARHLGLKAMSEKVAELCTNKYLQRSFFKENGIRTPCFRQIESLEDLLHIDHFPSIIKPIDSSASRGVKKVNNRQELDSQYRVAMSFSKMSKVIVEDYIEGREYSVEGLSQNGITHIIAITEKTTLGEEHGYFVEDNHLIPAQVTEEEERLIKAEVLNAIGKMGIDNCPTHTEVKLNEQGAFIIEIACRLGGDYITSDLVPLATGIDMLEALIKTSMGDAVDPLPSISKVASIQFLNTKNYDRCCEFVKNASEHIIRSEVKNYHANVITSSMNRMGYILLQTNTIDEMNKTLAKSREVIV